MNIDIKQRDRIIFGDKTPEYVGRIEHFEINLNQLEQLIDGDFIDLLKRKNFCTHVPIAQEYFKGYELIKFGRFC